MSEKTTGRKSMTPIEDKDHGYRKAYGSKDQYKEAYRKSFLRGYDDAFNRRGH